MALRLDQKIALLSAVPVLARLEPAAMHVLAFAVEERRHRPGEQIFAKNETSDGGYLVVEGRIAMDLSGEGIRGAESFASGVLIGEAALFAVTQRPATAIAVEPSQTLFVSRETMHRVLEAHPRSAADLRAYIVTQLAGTKQDLTTLLRG